MLFRFASLFLLSIPGTSFAQGQLWVVDAAGGPGFHFTDIQPAVDAASNGDTIFVRSYRFPYGAIDVQGKSLVIVGERRGGVSCNSLTTRAMPTGTELAVRNLTISFGFVFENNQGPIFLEDCDTRGSSALFASNPGALISNCRYVSFTRCRILGASQLLSYFSAGIPGGHGIDSASSTLVLHQTQVHGGEGGYGQAYSYQTPPGGNGLHLRSGRLFANDCEFIGGKGGRGAGWEISYPYIVYCSDGGTGGSGARVESGARADLYNSSFDGGLGGDGGYFQNILLVTAVCSRGPHGANLVGQARQSTGDHLKLYTFGPVRIGASTVVGINGPPGTLALLLVSTRQAPFDFGGSRGVLIPDVVGSRLFLLGNVTPEGVFTIVPTTSYFSMSGMTENLYLQAGLMDPVLLDIQLTSPSLLTILPP